jgi:hypothetical protein
MIHAGASYIEAAYAVSLLGLAALASVVVWRFLYWSRQARDLNAPEPTP